MTTTTTEYRLPTGEEVERLLRLARRSLTAGTPRQARNWRGRFDAYAAKLTAAGVAAQADSVWAYAEAEVTR